jgi:MSHA pilin protein MshC
MKQYRGFTTIELVTVIIIVAILAVNVLPRFDGTASYEAHTHRAQLISALRLTQQRAMQQTGADIKNNSTFCHQLTIEEKRYGIENRSECPLTPNINKVGWTPDATGHIVDDSYEVSFTIDGTTLNNVEFNWLGQPNDCDNSGSLGCTILVESAVEKGADALKIKIEVEGYIHGTP